MTKRDWRKQFETKEFDRGARPAKVCFSWSSLESFVQDISSKERSKLLAEVESWLVDEDTRRAMLKRENLMEFASVLSKNQLRAELRAKVQEMKGKL